ncbi:MAG: hypothetical protein AAF399_25020, partial [Bacteroidota bacterium]
MERNFVYNVLIPNGASFQPLTKTSRMTSTPLAQLKAFLNQLFQFDSQDLDFGVYKILHYKKK